MKIADIQADPRFGGQGRDDYEHQQNLLSASQGLRDAGFYREAYAIATRLSQEKSTQNYGDYMIKEGKRLADELRQKHGLMELTRDSDSRQKMTTTSAAAP